MEQLTRIIPLNPNRAASTAHDPAGVTAQAGFVKKEVAQAAEPVLADDPAKAQRFASELQYVTHFAVQLAEILGVKPLQFGVVEDVDSQTTFLQGANGWTGRVSRTRRSIALARTTLLQP